MNILIVGNGFDLSHYLPTKYDHFMVAMDAIENWDESKGEMRFDDLFGKDYWHKNDETGEEWQNKFFQYTKAMYKTDEIKISIDQIKELKEKLKENVWYQYFSDHVREVKTWIDFETKINEALNILSVFFIDVKKAYDKTGNFQERIVIGELTKDQKYILTQRKFNILSVLGIFEKNNNYGISANNKYGKDVIAGKFSEHCFIVPNDGIYGFNYLGYMEFLQKSLEFFTRVFNSYLGSVVSKLSHNSSLSIESEDWIRPNRIYSFNYTNTYQRLHDSVNTEYLHGRHGEDQNIVLGISDLDSEDLKNIKAFGFTKYHQKMMKDISFKFLSDNKDVQHMIESFWSKGKALSKKVRNENEICINIWGHSLDRSDENYIKEIFSFNSKKDENIRVLIYYFNLDAKSSIISNLFSILGKNIVEIWIRSGWLQFKENPNIAEINGIKPVDLPKM